MATKLYDEFYWKRKELMRLRNIYKKRATRAKQAGLYDATYLSQITQGTLGYKTPTKNTKPGEDMDLFSIDSFLRRDENYQEQQIRILERKIGQLKDILDNPMSSLRGMKDYLKAQLKTNKLNMQSQEVIDKLSEFRKNPEGYFKKNKVQAIMDAIDAHPDLTDDEKNKLKTLIRKRLDRREKVDYDDWILEWDIDIDEILKDPKAVIDRLSEGIPDDVLESLLNEAKTVPTTNNPRELGF